MAAEIGNRLFYKGLPDDKNAEDKGAGPGVPS
jgi:hypothetical protein